MAERATDARSEIQLGEEVKIAGGCETWCESLLSFFVKYCLGNGLSNLILSDKVSSGKRGMRRSWKGGWQGAEYTVNCQGYGAGICESRGALSYVPCAALRCVVHHWHATGVIMKYIQPLQHMTS